jgi:hypothetical protein
MEIVDNAIMLLIPGAMEAGLANVLFWGALSVALVVAGAFAFPANRWLIARGKGHTAVHNTGIHGGPPVKLVDAIAGAATPPWRAAPTGSEARPRRHLEHSADNRGAGHARRSTISLKVSADRPQLRRGVLHPCARPRP